jgi:hypothetical protein
VVVTEQERDDAGDYGYDMAHEGRAHVRRNGARAPHDTQHQRHSTAHPGGTSDRGEDYAYDEAHDF